LDEWTQVYLNTILSCWDLVDKEGDQIDDIIRLGLEDASMKGRELAREAFISFRHIFPEKAERLKASLSSSVLSRVVKAEVKYENKKRIQQATQLQKEEDLRISSQLTTSPIPRSASDEDYDNILSKSTPSGRKPEGDQDNNAVSSIQALIRGNMTKRFSTNPDPDPNRFSVLDKRPGHSSSEYMDDNMEPIIVPSHGNNEFHDTNNNNMRNVDMNIPLYLQQQQQAQTPVNSLSPHASTWYEADQISPLTMDNGHGRNSHENGHQASPHGHNSHENSHNSHENGHHSPQRKTMSPTKSPPPPMAAKVKSASLR
jgi:hypothetical protein